MGNTNSPCSGEMRSTVYTKALADDRRGTLSLYLGGLRHNRLRSGGAFCGLKGGWHQMTRVKFHRTDVNNVPCFQYTHLTLFATYPHAEGVEHNITVFVPSEDDEHH